MTEEFIDIFSDDIDFTPVEVPFYVDGHYINTHPHAFVKEDIVINVAGFNSHDHDLIDAVRIANNADWVQCLCDYGKSIGPGWIWNGVEFIPGEQND